MLFSKVIRNFFKYWGLFDERRVVLRAERSFKEEGFIVHKEDQLRERRRPKDDGEDIALGIRLLISSGCLYNPSKDSIL